MAAVHVASLRAEIGVDGEVAAGAALNRFGTKVEETSSRSSRAFGRMGVAAETVDHQLAHFGVPFTGTAGRVITSFERMESRGASLGSRLSTLGRTEATAAVIGLTAVATEGVHLADALELARAREETAVKNAGGSYDEYKGQLDDTDKKLEKLGFTYAETESGVAQLIRSTHDIGKAQRDAAIAADVSRGANRDYGSAAKLVTQVEAGRYKGLVALGIATKDQIAGFHTTEAGVSFLAAAFRGDAAAATETFAGKMKVLSAEGQDLGATLGLAVVPKIESAAQAALTGVHAFQDFNTATHGIAGNVLAFGAAVPIAYFGLQKLASYGAAAGGALDSVIASATGAARAVVTGQNSEATAITTANGARLQAVTADESLVVAESEVAAASERTAATQLLAGESAAAASGAFATLGTALPWVAGGLIAVHVAGSQLNRVISASSGSTDELVTSLKGLADSGRADATLIAKYGANYQSLKHDIDDVRDSSKGLGHITDFTHNLIGLSTDSEQHVKQLSNSLKDLYKTDPQAAIASFQNIKAHLIANGETAAHVDKAFKGLEQTIGGMTGPVDAATQAQTNLTEAQAKYASDIVRHASGSVLAADYAKVKSASTVVADAQGQVAAATEAGSAAIASGAAAATSGSYAYLGLADSVKTAAAALAGSITAATSAASSPYQLQLDTSAAQASALDLHGKLDTASTGGGGGAGKTATAAAIDQKEKELALRDALRAVGTTASQVRDATESLSDARGQQAIANKALIVAENNYKHVLDGVSESSKTARDAQVALTQAQRDAENSALDVQAAERSLELARSDSRLNGFGPADAQRTLDASRAAAATANSATASAEAQLAAVRGSSTATASDIASAELAVTNARTAAVPLNEQVTKDEVSLDDARINAKAGTEAITRAELALKNQRADAKQKTQDLDTAEKTLKYTLDGYPKSSEAAKAATLALRDAQKAQRDAVDGVRHATDQLVDAQAQIATTAVQVERAQADLSGKLTTAAGAGGGMGKLETRAASLIGKLEDLRTKSIAVASDIAAAISTSTHSYGEGVDAFIRNLALAVDNEPLLKGAFDSVIAQMRANLNKFYFQPGNSAPPGSAVHRVLTGPPVAKHASGGTIGPDEYGVVGDINGLGGELVKGLPGGGARVYTHQQSVRALGGDTANVERLLQRLVHHFTVNGGRSPSTPLVGTIIARDAEDTMRKIDQQQKRQYLLTNF